MKMGKLTAAVVLAVSLTVAAATDARAATSSGKVSDVFSDGVRMFFHVSGAQYCTNTNSQVRFVIPISSTALITLMLSAALAGKNVTVNGSTACVNDGDTAVQLLVVNM